MSTEINQKKSFNRVKEHTPQGNCMQFSVSLYVHLTMSLKRWGFAGYLEEIPEQLIILNKTSGIYLLYFLIYC